MACANIESLFLSHAGLIRNDVAKNLSQSDFYIKHLPKEAWMDGQGDVYSYPIYERTLPTDAVNFSNWSVSPGDGDMLTTNDSNPADASTVLAGGACSLSGVNIDSFGVTVRQTQLKRAAINSPKICLEDLRFQWQVEDQVKNVVRVLTEITKWVWANAYQDEYIASCGQKIIAEPALAEGSASFPLTEPTSKLSWGILEMVYERLGYNGGGMNPFMRQDEMTPIYAAVGDRFTFHDLKRLDSNTRDDFHYAYEGDKTGSPMLSGPGLQGVYRGFKFFTVEFPPRYDFVSGAWVRRQPYADLAATRGRKWEVSQAYRDAEYTDTVIYHADVMKCLTPKPVSAKGGMSFNPQYSWAGEFAWRNIPDLDCNVDGNIGFFRALYAYGPKIERPDLGFVIRHQRCQRALDLVACY